MASSTKPFIEASIGVKGGKIVKIADGVFKKKHLKNKKIKLF